MAIDDAQLYLLRHGAAGGKSEANSFEEDYIRPLTEKGVRQSIAAGQVLEQLAGKIHAIHTSPRVRTVQTAVLIGQELGVEAHRDKDLLQMKPKAGAHLIEEGKATVIVGHGPELNDLVKHLTGREVQMGKGAIAGIQITKGQGSLKQLLTAKDVAGLA